MVHPIGVLTDQLIPGRHGGLVPGGVGIRRCPAITDGSNPLVADLLGMRHAGLTKVVMVAIEILNLHPQ